MRGAKGLARGFACMLVGVAVFYCEALLFHLLWDVPEPFAPSNDCPGPSSRVRAFFPAHGFQRHVNSWGQLIAPAIVSYGSVPAPRVKEM